MASAVADVSLRHGFPVNWISSNPRDCLAYTYVDDLLDATKLLLPKADREKRLRETVGLYEIGPMLGQQVHTLSGGEVVRLALARNDLLSKVANRIVISSPLTWLSVSNRVAYDRFVGSYSSPGKEVVVLAMQGEYDSESSLHQSHSKIEAELVVQGLRICLGSSDLQNAEAEHWAEAHDTRMLFRSPCLVTGENGSGKSLLARALSGSVNYCGTAKISTNGYSGHARLLFQDVVMQTMLRPFPVLKAASRGVTSDAINEEYQKLIGAFVEHYHANGVPVPYIGSSDGAPRTLLEYKFMLVAARIAAHPPALILDEPDWGLARSVAEGFVQAVVDVADESGVAILLISHKEWWRTLARSHFHVTKEVACDNDVRLRIRVQEVWRESASAS